MRSVIRRHACLVLLGMAAVAATACSPTRPASTPTPTPTPADQPSSPSQLADAGPPSLAVTPADGAGGVLLDSPIQVIADNATVSTVAVTENGGAVSLDWTSEDSGTEWIYTGGLDLDSSYAITATAVSGGGGGGETVTSSTFHTMSGARRLLTTVLDMSGGQTVGVGMPIELEFNTAIPAAYRSGIIAHIAVVSDPPQPGGWYWVDGEDVHYRPESFWQTGTAVTVDAELNGVDAGNGYWGLGNWSMSFGIGPAHLTVVNTQTRQMQLYDGDSASTGTLLDTWPTNTGKPSFDTIDGTLVVLAHLPVVFMQSCPTFRTAAACIPGGSEYYAENVYDDTAVSSDGYFIHAAPWVCSGDTCSLWPYGDVNSSHGCINLSTAHAVTYYGWSQVGDPVEVTGSPQQATYGDGEGDWQTPWSDYLPGGEAIPPVALPAAATTA
ncbi:MAG: Ig-like domain-containing protein [Candidatus Dormibacteria bacterium]